MFELYLASASPRRRELLEQIGVKYRLLKVDVPEEVAPGESAEEFARRVALEKARAGRVLLSADALAPVLGADTCVVVDDAVLGKPRDQEDALNMLELLSGRSHQVISAVALAAEEEAVCLSKSRVFFREISAAERQAYWDSGEPRDKAGSYAIQGLGAIFVERLEGSYSGVMGLPVFETAQLLRKVGINVLDGQHQEGGKQ